MNCAKCGKEIDQEFLANYIAIAPDEIKFCDKCLLETVKTIIANEYEPATVQYFRTGRHYGKSFTAAYIDELLTMEIEDDKED